MFPAFDSGVTHYGIRCDSTDVLQISAAAASPWHKLYVDNRPRAWGLLKFVVANPAGDQDIVISVSQGSQVSSYTLHCIASDVPDIEVRVSTPESGEGLLYLTPQFDDSGARKTYLMIVDANGVPRFRRKIDGRAVDFKRHPNGLYTYAIGVGRNPFGLVDFAIVVLDESFIEIDRLSTVGLTHTDNHDFLFTPEGTRIFISYNSTVRDMTAFGLSAEEVVGDSVIQEVDENGNVVFEWNSWDHLDISDCQQSGYPRFPDDYGHLNAISLTEDGDLIGSFRGCGQVLKIDRPGGTVEWYLGGSNSDFLVTGDPFDEFCGQHTAWQLANGNILMFDNGNYCLGERESLYGQFSRVVEYALDFQTMQATFVRDYSLDGLYQAFTSSQGSVQPLSNGNWLISWGRGPDTSVTEVTQSGGKVFEIRLSVGGDTAFSYRAYKDERSEIR